MEGPVLGGATSATVSDGGLVTLAATDAALDGDDTLGTVTITGLPGDLSTFNAGTYTAASGTWTGTAAQFNALTFNAGTTSATLSISAITTGAEAGTTTENYTLTVNNPNQDDWTGGAGDGNWATSGNWDKGVPTSTMTADLDLAGSYTVTSAGTVTVNGLVSTATATLDVTGGTFTVTNFTGQGPLILSGGTFNIGSSTASVASLTESGGTLMGSGTLTVTGATNFSAGTSTESGTGKTIAQSGATFSTTNNLTLTVDARTLQLSGNSAVTGFGGIINLNDSGQLIVASGALFDDQTTTGGTFTVRSIAGTAGAVTNLGTWQKSGSSSDSVVSVAFNSTGTDASHLATVNVETGTLTLSGGGTDTFTQYTGAGTIEFGGGTRTLDAASSITAHTLFSGSESTTVNGTYNAAGTAVSGGTASLAGTVTGLGATTVSGGTLNLNGASTTAASLSQSGGTLMGSGTLTVTGATNFSAGTSTESGTGKTIAQKGRQLCQWHRQSDAERAQAGRCRALAPAPARRTASTT